MSKKTISQLPGISRAEVDNVSRQIEKLDPREHVPAFNLVMNLYGQTDPIKAKLYVTTLKEKAQEWFTNLESGTIDSDEQLMQKFPFHFVSKTKAKRPATYLFTIRQRDDETLKSFRGRFDMKCWRYRISEWI
ncbi:UNVERIFIED_CONTAM: hypothetical protein Sindi_0665000 [Sesamum indicum]